MNSPESPLAGPTRHELAHLKNDWWYFLLLGIVTLVLGVAAISFAPFVSVGYVFILGILLGVAGAAQIISSFWAGKWSGFFLHLLVGIFYIVVGLMIIESPLNATVAITMVVAAFLLVVGIFRMASALITRFSHWGWALLSGFISAILGLMIIRMTREFPPQALMIIGLFVGIEMIFNGWTWIMLSLALRSSDEVEG